MYYNVAVVRRKCEVPVGCMDRDVSMEEIVRELKKVVNFKDSTRVGDVVLVAIENPRSVFYAVVTGITRDENKRDEWWHVAMSILSVPPQEVVWTLREAQFTGREIFTMANDGRFMKAVDFSGRRDGGKGAPRPGLRRVK